MNDCSGYLDFQKANSEDCGNCQNREHCVLKAEGCKGWYFVAKQKKEASK
jgi:hypothetical protein